MNETPPSQPDDPAVEEAAEHAERAVQERREMARLASQAQAADGATEGTLFDASAEHGRAARAEETAADGAARRADGDDDHAA
jgi:hypothetical protein